MIGTKGHVTYSFSQLIYFFLVLYQLSLEFPISQNLDETIFKRWQSLLVTLEIEILVFIDTESSHIGSYSLKVVFKIALVKIYYSITSFNLSLATVWNF